MAQIELTDDDTATYQAKTSQGSEVTAASPTRNSPHLHMLPRWRRPRQLDCLAAGGPPTRPPARAARRACHRQHATLPARALASTRVMLDSRARCGTCAASRNPPINRQLPTTARAPLARRPPVATRAPHMRQVALPNSRPTARHPPPHRTPDRIKIANGHCRPHSVLPLPAVQTPRYLQLRGAPRPAHLRDRASAGELGGDRQLHQSDTGLQAEVRSPRHALGPLRAPPSLHDVRCMVARPRGAGRARARGDGLRGASIRGRPRAAIARLGCRRAACPSCA